MCRFFIYLQNQSNFRNVRETLRFIFILHVWVFCLCIRMHTVCMSGAYRSQRVSGPWELELRLELWACLWMLGTEPEAAAASSVNPWVISLPLRLTELELGFSVLFLVLECEKFPIVYYTHFYFRSVSNDQVFFLPSDEQPSSKTGGKQNHSPGWFPQNQITAVVFQCFLSLRNSARRWRCARRAHPLQWSP